MNWRVATACNSVVVLQGASAKQHLPWILPWLPGFLELHTVCTSPFSTPTPP